MYRTILTTLALLLLAATPAQASDVIAEGHIIGGAPTTSALTVAEAAAVENVDSFFFAAPAAGTSITTSTTDNSGLGYDLDFYFWDANGGYIGSCATSAADEVCEVPAGAATGEVAAYLGVDLDVVVLTAA